MGLFNGGNELGAGLEVLLVIGEDVVDLAVDIGNQDLLCPLLQSQQEAIGLVDHLVHHSRSLLRHLSDQLS